jgi:hypothetical protein
MFSVFGGAVLLAGSLGVFWRLRPHEGVPHRLAVAPFLQVAIPVTLVSGVVVGIGLIASGLADLFAT